MRADRLTQNLARGCTRQPPGGGPGRSFDGAVEQPPACQPMRVVALPEHSLSSIDVAAHAPGCREAPRPISVGGGRRPRWVASRPMSPTARAANTERAVGTQLRWRESNLSRGVWTWWGRALWVEVHAVGSSLGRHGRLRSARAHARRGGPRSCGRDAQPPSANLPVWSSECIETNTNDFGMVPRLTRREVRRYEPSRADPARPHG